MRYLVFNSKGGCGKSTVAREVIAGPLAAQVVVVELDELNQTQSAYADTFKEVVQLTQRNIGELLALLNLHDHVVIDVGVDNVADTLEQLISLNIIDDIDRVVIPMMPGRTDSENALATYEAIRDHCRDILFAFVRASDDDLQSQYAVFFKPSNLEAAGIKLTPHNHIVVHASDVFVRAQDLRQLVVQMATEKPYKAEALKARDAGNIEAFKRLMAQEMDKRTAQLLLEKTVMPAHRIVTRAEVA